LISVKAASGWRRMIESMPTGAMQVAPEAAGRCIGAKAAMQVQRG
jgi:hypothetical protein